MNYTEEEFTEKIQRFLSGDMTESEREAFETLMEQDELLRDEVDFQRGLTQFLRDEGARKLQDRVKQLKTAQENEFTFPWKKALAAILILGLLAIPAYYFVSNSTPEGPELSATYFEPYPDRITQMGDERDSLELAMSFYNSKEYEKAATLLEVLSPDSSGYASLYLSICQIQNDQASKAISTLNSQIDILGDESEVKPVLHWYLILAYLKANRPNEAKVELKAYLRKKYRFELDKAQQLAEELGVED